VVRALVHAGPTRWRHLALVLVRVILTVVESVTVQRRVDTVPILTCELCVVAVRVFWSKEWHRTCVICMSDNVITIVFYVNTLCVLCHHYVYCVITMCVLCHHYAYYIITICVLCHHYVYYFITMCIISSLCVYYVITMCTMSSLCVYYVITMCVLCHHYVCTMSSLRVYYIMTKCTMSSLCVL
jgi:hypothetical protein